MDSWKQRDTIVTATMVYMHISTQLTGPHREGYWPLVEGGEIRSQARLLEMEKGGFPQEMGLGPTLTDWAGLRLVKRKRKFSSWLGMSKRK